MADFNRFYYIFFTQPRPELTGLDCCFNASGDFEGCTISQVKKIVSRYFQRVPESFKKGMSEEEFIETGGVGKEELNRTRTLAVEVRRLIAERTNTTVSNKLSIYLSLLLDR